jgi:ATP synthase protein I
MGWLGRSRGQTLGTLGALSAVGLAFVFAVAIGAATGYGLDRWWGTSPWLFLLFFFLGAAAGVLNVVRVASAARRAGRGDDQEGAGSHPPTPGT